MEKFGVTWREIYAAALVAIERRDRGSTGLRRVIDVPTYTPTDGQP
jgi:hypothetical protein